MSVYVGTSGWSYDDWDGSFYPAELPRARWFDHYAAIFPTVEINYSFYRLPSEKTIEGWRQKAPAGFRFAIKGSRYITHIKRLRDADDAVERFLERVRPLRARLGPILWQLPPNQHLDLERLDAFARLLPRRPHQAIEFRHRSWFTAETFDVLRAHDIAHVHVSREGFPRDLTVTTDVVYARFHGLSGGPAHDYTRGQLRRWAEHLRAHGDKECWAYFNNDVQARAPANARTFMAMLGADG